MDNRKIENIKNRAENLHNIIENKTASSVSKVVYKPKL